jgi:excisionase family DNA binding protein
MQENAVTSEQPPKLLDVRSVAALLGSSTKHVWRLRDDGLLPAPVRVGALVRWRASDLNRWIEQGCPAGGIPQEVT